MDFPSDEHLIAVGTITVAAGQLEAGLYVLAEAVVDPNPDVVSAVLQGATFEKTLNVVSDLVTIKRPGGRWKQFDDWAAEAKAAMRERNRLLHGEWVTSFAGDDGFVPAVWSRGRRGSYAVTFHATAAALVATAHRLQGLVEQTEWILADMVEWGGSWESDGEGGWQPPAKMFGTSGRY